MQQVKNLHTATGSTEKLIRFFQCVAQLHKENAKVKYIYILEYK